MNDMTQLLYSMEQGMRLQNRARAERRAARAEQEKREFQEKLMRAAASEMELDGISRWYGFKGERFPGCRAARPADQHDDGRILAGYPGKE